MLVLHAHVRESICCEIYRKLLSNPRSICIRPVITVTRETIECYSRIGVRETLLIVSNSFYPTFRTPKVVEMPAEQPRSIWFRGES